MASHVLAGELGGKIGGAGEKREISTACGSTHNSFVVGDFGEELPKVRPLLLMPMGDERLPGSTHRELRPEMDVLFEPTARGSVDDLGSNPGNDREADDQGYDESNRPEHDRGM